MIGNKSFNKMTKVCKTIVIVGSNEVGKTTILQRYIKKKFDDSYIETIGVDYYSKESSSQKWGNIVFSIWDTCGSEIELKILPSNIYKVASAYVIVCSYDKKDSFDMLKSWITHAQNYINNSYKNSSFLVPILVLVNKCDIKKDRKFKLSDVMKIIDEFSLNIIVYEISAKENIKVDYAFDKIGGMLSGRLSVANENSQNSTNADGFTHTEVSTRGRKRSFQLQGSFCESKIPFDKGAIQQGSCCK